MEYQKHVKLKKDGTPDRRNGNPGNKGNRFPSVGRKPDKGIARKMIAFSASEKEYGLIMEFVHILKKDESRARKIRQLLGTPPMGRAKKGANRKRFTTRATEDEKKLIKEVAAIVKDRYEAAQYIIENH